MEKGKYGRKLIAVVICILLLTTGCADKAEAVMMDTTVAVDTQVVENGELTSEGTYVGTVSDAESVSVVPQVAGTVEAVHVVVGDMVTAGDALCDYDDTNAEFTLANAQGSYASAQVSYESAKAGYNSAVAGYNSTQASVDANLNSSKKLSDSKTQGNIESLQQTLNNQIESIEDYRDDKDEASDDKDDAKKSRDRAQNAYSEAAAKYQTAESLLSSYKYYLDNNPSSFTTSGLEEAASESVSGNSIDDQGTARALLDALNSAGLAVENLNSSGIALLRENMESAKSAYASAATAYSTAKSSKNSIEDTIDSLEDSRNSTAASLAQAQEEQKINNEDVYADSKKSADASLTVAETSVDSAKVGIHAAQVGIDSAQVSVDSAEYQLSLYHIKAPISGVVEEVNLTEQNLYSSGTVAFVISNPQSKMVTFYVTDSVKEELVAGQTVTVKNKDKSYQGSISEIGISVDAETGLFKVKATIYDASDLANGSNVEITTITHTSKNVVLVPSDAVYFENGDAYVYVAEKAIAKKMPVTIDLYRQDKIGIASGLQAGQEVITTWSSSLKDGASIRPPQSEQTVSSNGIEEMTTEEANEKSIILEETVAE